jgi:hypothetical protein
LPIQGQPAGKLILTDGQLGIGPGLPTCFVLTQESCQASGEIFSIPITEENLLPSNSMSDYVKQGAWGI